MASMLGPPVGAHSNHRSTSETLSALGNIRGAGMNTDNSGHQAPLRAQRRCQNIVAHSLSTWKLIEFLREARLRGIAITPELNRHGVMMADIAEWGDTVPFAMARRAFEALAEAVPPDFAVSLGRKWHLREFGLFGYALLSCRTFGEFTDHWIGHFDFLGIPMNFRSVVDKEGWRIEMKPKDTLSDGAIRICVEEACASVFPIFEQLTGGVLKAKRVDITVGTSGYSEQLGALLDTTVRSGAARNALVLDPAYRSKVIEIGEGVLRDFCNRNCGAIAAALTGDPLLDKLRDIMLMSCGRPPALEVAAIQLGVSKRTLNRALATHGWTYTAASHCYRRDYALELLKMREVAAKEIAFILGYGGAESFRRAFRKWTGETVGDWTRAAIGCAPPRN